MGRGREEAEREAIRLGIKGARSLGIEGIYGSTWSVCICADLPTAAYLLAGFQSFTQTHT